MAKKISEVLQETKEDSWFEEYVIGNAPLILAIFANFVVIVTDYRAYHVVFGLTGSWWKALSASLACAIPFLLWELGWQYNYTTPSWRRVSLGMAGLAFATSIFLGVADFLGFQGAWANVLLGGVVIVTGLHTIVGLLYYYNDPDVAVKRHQRQAEAAMLIQEVNAQKAEQILASGANLLETISRLEKQYSPEEVEAVMNIIQGKRKARPTGPGKQNKGSNPPATMPAGDTQRPQSATHEEKRVPVPHRNGQQPQIREYTLAELLNSIGKNQAQFRDFLIETETYSKAWQVLRDDGRLPAGIVKRNFYALAEQVHPEGARNPH